MEGFSGGGSLEEGKGEGESFGGILEFVVDEMELKEEEDDGRKLYKLWLLWLWWR